MKFKFVIPENSSRKGRLGWSFLSRQQVFTTRSSDLSFDLDDQLFMKFRVESKRQEQTFPVNVSDSRRGATSPSRRHRCGGLAPSPSQRLWELSLL